MSKLKNTIEKLFPEFQVVSCLSNAAHKATYKMRRTNQEKYYILKMFFLNHQSKEEVGKMIELLKKLTLKKSPYILKMYEATFDENITYLS